MTDEISSVSIELSMGDMKKTVTVRMRGTDDAQGDTSALEARLAAALAENARLSEQVSRLWAAFRRK